MRQHRKFHVSGTRRAFMRFGNRVKGTWGEALAWESSRYVVATQRYVEKIVEDRVYSSLSRP